MNRIPCSRLIATTLAFIVGIGIAQSASGEPTDHLRRLAHATDWCRRDKFINDKDHRGPVGSVASITHDIPAHVNRKATVTATIRWELSNPGGSPVAHNTVFADWQPDSSLAHLKYTFSSATSKSMQITFTAPSAPGRYRIRWMHIHAYLPIRSFFGGTDGDGPMKGDYATSPHVWMEVPIEVK